MRQPSFKDYFFVVAGIALATFGLAGAEPSYTEPRFLWGEGTPRFERIPGGSPDEAVAEAAAGFNVPLWSGSFVFQGTKFPFTMVGTDPSLGSATSSIPVVIVPIKFAFAGGVTLSASDPVCGGALSAVSLVQTSPLFENFEFAPGGTLVGTTQYIDAFQRANFWDKVSTVAPDYHVLLSVAAVAPTQTIKVTRFQGSVQPGPCAKVGQVKMSAFNKIAQQLITSLGIPSTSLPLFLTYNTFFTQGACCVLGFHSVTSSNHTYAVAAYSDPGIFNVPIEDIHALSHELGEWLDDPLVNNPTPGWQAGQAMSCQKNLEVGDPVTGIASTVTLNNVDYHPEDLVFLSWFARESPSTAVNGWYTFLNSFASPPPVFH